jgi:hypothetical protein
MADVYCKNVCIEVKCMFLVQFNQKNVYPVSYVS